MDKEIYCVAGHSFCRKLEIFCDRPGWRNLGMESSTVDFHHEHAGKNITFYRHLHAWVYANEEYLKTVTVMCWEIGTNDLLEHDSVFYYNPELLAQAVFNLARKALDFGVKRVAIMEIIYREGQAAVPRHQQPVHDQSRITKAVDKFRSSALHYNMVMLEFTLDHPNLPIVFLKQDGVHRRWGSRLCDGCHFNDKAQKTHFHNVRNALMRQAGLARGKRD